MIVVVGEDNKGIGATIRAQDTVDILCSIQVLTYWDDTLQIPPISQICKNTESVLAPLTISLSDTPGSEEQYLSTRLMDLK